MATGLEGLCAQIPEQVLRAACDKIVADPTALLGAILAALIIAAVKPIRRWVWGVLKSIGFRLSTVWTAGGRLDRARQSVAVDGLGPWLTIKRDPPRDYDDRMQSAVGSTPVTVCANEKGGVGKTTITCNLAARFAALKQKPVLVIDLDFQGSGSSMVFAGTRWQPTAGQLSAASLAISGDQARTWLAGAARPATWMQNPETPTQKLLQVERIEGIAAFHDLAETEDRIKLLWAIGEQKRDIRYFLYELLHDPSLRDKFSMIFIDAPPRLTTSCVQALCASNYLIIPTVLDELSADAVGYFGKQLKRHEELWPHLKVLGIVGSLKEGQNHEKPALTSAGDALRTSLRDSKYKLNAVQASGKSFEFPYEVAVPKMAALGRSAGRGIAYATLGNNNDGRDVRGVFDALAAEVIERMHL